MYLAAYDEEIKRTNECETERNETVRSENFSQCRQWSGDEEDEGTRSGHMTTEHPLAEATIPLISHSRLQEPPSVLNVVNVPTGGSQNATHRATQSSQQESVLQKFRKSFSLRFHKKGSKESNEECPADDNDGSGPLDEEEGRETPTVTSSSEQSSQHKDDSSNDQKFRFVSRVSCLAPLLSGRNLRFRFYIRVAFAYYRTLQARVINLTECSSHFRFGPLVWRSSKERKKSNKAARNAKCNSGDSGIQIEVNRNSRSLSCARNERGESSRNVKRDVWTSRSGLSRDQETVVLVR